jgi:hypothetical protein
MKDAGTIYSLGYNLHNYHPSLPRSQRWKFKRGKEMKIRLIKFFLSLLFFSASVTILAKENLAVFTVVANSTLRESVMLQLPMQNSHVSPVIHPQAVNQKIGTFNLIPDHEITYLTTNHSKTVHCGTVQKIPRAKIIINVYRNNETFKCSMQTITQ